MVFGGPPEPNTLKNIVLFETWYEMDRHEPDEGKIDIDGFLHLSTLLCPKKIL